MSQSLSRVPCDHEHWVAISRYHAAIRDPIRIVGHRMMTAHAAMIARSIIVAHGRTVAQPATVARAATIARSTIVARVATMHVARRTMR